MASTVASVSVFANVSSPLRVLFYIDSIHCGGAQRQLCTLAANLKLLGHEAHVAVYYPKYDFFKQYLREHNVPLHELSKRSPWGMVADLSRLVRSLQVNWVIPFLEGPTFYTLLTKFLRGGFQVCVAERSSNIDGKMKPKQRLIRSMYRCAKLVTANSQYQASFVAANFSWAQSRLHVIRNCVPHEFFDMYPKRTLRADGSWDTDRDWLAVVGQIAPWKNLHGLVAALNWYLEHLGIPPRIRWAGRDAEDFLDYVRTQKQAIAKQPWRDRLEFVGNLSNIPEFLSQASGLLHPSILEGYPNAVCEAFAVGLPAVIGDVSDAKHLIGQDRGLLFDPHSPESMARAIYQFVQLPIHEIRDMGCRAHRYAALEMKENAMAEAYADLLLAHSV